MKWTLEGTIARLDAQGWHLSVDLSHPQLGVVLDREQSQAFPRTESKRGAFRLFRCHWTGAELSPGLTDCYCRQSDLVAAYAPNSLRDFQVQIDFRVLEASPEFLRMEAWISTQTFLLESHPKVGLEFQVPFVPLQRWFHGEQGEIREAGCHLEAQASGVVGTLISAPHTTANLLILIYRGDLGEVRWRTDVKKAGSIQQEWFGASMEKGVIRRGRLRAIVFCTDVSSRRVAEEYALFQSSPLPLTV